MVNASPDSLADFSVATTVEGAVARSAELLDGGCAGIDLGGAGSTQFADRVDIDTEWGRLDGKVQALAALCADRGAVLSVDSWQPEIVRRALDCGATMINAADGLQNPAMVRLAARSDVPVVVPFVWGADPKASRHVTGDPAEVICEWFRRSLPRWEGAGVEREPADPRPGHRVRPARLGMGGPLPLPEAGLREPRRPAGLRAADLPAPALEADRPARRAAGDLHTVRLRLRPLPPARSGPGCNEAHRLVEVRVMAPVGLRAGSSPRNWQRLVWYAGILLPVRGRLEASLGCLLVGRELS